VLLSILGKLTEEETLARYGKLWDVKSKSFTDKLEIYLLYIITQNGARLRLPRQ
jgi:hypothetical protein